MDLGSWLTGCCPTRHSRMAHGIEEFSKLFIAYPDGSYIPQLSSYPFPFPVAPSTFRSFLLLSRAQMLALLDFVLVISWESSEFQQIHETSSWTFSLTCKRRKRQEGGKNVMKWEIKQTRYAEKVILVGVRFYLFSGRSWVGEETDHLPMGQYRTDARRVVRKENTVDWSSKFCMLGT